MTGSWLGQSLIAMLLLVPAWLSIGFFNRNFQVKPDVFLIWYFAGAIVTTLIFGGSPARALMPPWKVATSLALIGILAGGGANLLLFRAVAAAPNPGLPVAIANVASIGVFLTAAVASRWIPSRFDPVTVDLRSVVGILLAIAGTALIATKP